MDVDPELMWEILKAPPRKTLDQVYQGVYDRRTITLPRHVTEHIKAEANKKWAFLRRY